jgi:small subunit ribosomal protein S6
MPDTAPTYDLVLLLSKSADDDQRAKILADTEKAISGAGGSISRNDAWGTRPLSFRINHESEAEYHLLQFTAPPSLLESLSYTLRITDGVLRHRIIKLIPGTPPAPESAPPIVAATVPAAASAVPAAAPEPDEES